MEGGAMSMIKDIPGYRVILRAVLKGQIQYLVKQLADHAGEESVLLTASVSDGSFSHLGSESGKGFLLDHDDINSKFLGYCLKKYHKGHQTEPDEFIPSDPTPQFDGQKHFGGQKQFGGAKPRFKSTPFQMAPRSSHVISSGLHQRSVARSTPKVVLGKGARHKPYNTSGKAKTLLKPNQKAKATRPETKSIAEIKINANEIVKIEAVENDEDESNVDDARSEHSDASNDSELRSMDASQIQAAMVSLPLHNFIPATTVTESVQESALSREESVENSMSSIDHAGDAHLDIAERTNFAEESDRSEIGGGSADELNVNISMNVNNFDNQQSEVSGADESNIKLEANSDSELDLEITGIEPGVMIQSQGQGNIPGAKNSLGLGASTSSVQLGGVKGFKSRGTVVDLDDDDDDESSLSLAVYTDVDDLDSSSGRHSNRTCTVCGKWFASSSSLGMHMRIHTGEKPYKCETCGREFNQKGNLKTHRLSHMPKTSKTHGTQTFVYVTEDGVEKMFVKNRRKRIRKPSRRTKPCPICEKMFPSGSSLELHLRTHTGEKPYSCDECGKSFAQKGNLIKHQGGHHKTPLSGYLD